MIITKVFTIALALYLASSAHAASLNSRQAPVEATQCIENLKQVANLAPETIQLLKTKTSEEFAGLAESIVDKETKINQKLIDTQSACCPSDGPSGIFSDVDARFVDTTLQEVSNQLQALVSDYTTKQEEYKRVSYYAFSMADIFKQYGKATDSLFSCIAPRVPSFADQIQIHKNQFDVVLKKAIENEQQPYGANGGMLT